jgi:hypothetical protein
MSYFRLSPATAFAWLMAVAPPAAAAAQTSRAPAARAAAAPALVGRWDLTIRADSTSFPGWLEVRRDGSGFGGRLQWGWGHATPIAAITVAGDSFAFTWPNEEAPREPASRARGRVTRGAGRTLSALLVGGDDKQYALTGTRAPSLARTSADTAGWSAPADLLAGGLGGWHPRGEKNGWTVENGVLSNTLPSSDVISGGRFTDFKLHVEVNVPKDGNSGIYLRGRDEVQVLDSYGKPPGSREMGGIYGQVTPSRNAAKPAGEWQSYDITLVGRRVKVVLNGVTIINWAEIPGITGGALDSDEGAPGPIMLQGDHTAVRYRNIVVTPAQRRKRGATMLRRKDAR